MKWTMIESKCLHKSSISKGTVGLFTAMDCSTYIQPKQFSYQYVNNDDAFPTNKWINFNVRSWEDLRKTPERILEIFSALEKLF